MPNSSPDDHEEFAPPFMELFEAPATRTTLIIAVSTSILAIAFTLLTWNLDGSYWQLFGTLAVAAAIVNNFIVLVRLSMNRNLRHGGHD